MCVCMCVCVCSYHLAKIRFLAAMSSSRSDVVTQFVCSFVFLRVCPFFSFSVFEVSSCPKEFQWCLKAVLWLFEV